MAAIGMGSGVFLADTAKTFAQFQNFGEQGWQSQQSGALSANAMLMALTMFVRLGGGERRAAEREKAYPRGPFRNTMLVLDRRYPDMAAAVEAADLGDWE